MGVTTFKTGIKNTLDLSPEEFIAMKKNHPEEIKAVEILAPVLGKTDGFGRVRVHLAHARYEVVF